MISLLNAYRWLMRSLLGGEVLNVYDSVLNVRAPLLEAIEVLTIIVGFLRQDHARAPAVSEQLRRR